jgi:hypothetical protein
MMELQSQTATPTKVAPKERRGREGGAGQYFTPRSLIRAIGKVMQPRVA